MAKKVFVSGCYDMLHSGHVAFFTEAAKYGDLYVGIGSDKTIHELKNRNTINTDAERLYMVSALKVVKKAWINRGSGILDFLDDLKELSPDIFFVNSDGHTPAKEALCKDLGIEYIVSKRLPHEGLPVRSTTALRQECMIPYRIDLAGGWLDQPYVSKFFPGSVITICIEPDYEFNDRSGMSTSSRKRAIELWHTDIPEGDKIMLAKTLFCFENPPGTEYVSGSQDSLGITMPGLNKYDYNGHYWPENITTIPQSDILEWIEKHLWLVPLYPRKDGYSPLDNKSITKDKVESLSIAADNCWAALMKKDINLFGKAVTESFNAQIKLFPNMVNEDILEQIDNYKNDVLGWKLSGAGGGGYLIFISDKEVKNAIQIRIRRG
ncbi:MAG: adenylyltransferase/cytidyltransferase family protein [Bacteroidales bacterium]|nr:adenylyltransferase/cytidyltransferase family protein [Bacteroidales bacterium]